jgi:hypothetical protein
MMFDPLAGTAGKPAKSIRLRSSGSTARREIATVTIGFRSVAHSQRIRRAMRPCCLQQIIQIAVAIGIEIDRIPILAIEFRRWISILP